MTKEVFITIKGQQLGEEEDPVIMIAPGTYHFMNGKHYIHYEENIEESDDISKNTVKVSSDRIILMKKGTQYAQMIFDLKEKEHAVYQTPFGTLTFETDTKAIQVRETKDKLEIRLEYSLFTDGTKMSDNLLIMTIEAR